MRLEAKIALVTGSSRGIGRAIALALAREGADITINYNKNRQKAYEVADEVRALGRRSLVVKADVSKSREVQGMVQKVLEEFRRIDILVNNAGVIYLGFLSNSTEEQWDRQMDVNVKGVFLCSKAVVEQMKKQGGGRIVNIASMAGKTAIPLLGPYSASKFAVIGLTQAIALEVAEFGINVNAVCPGNVVTEMSNSELVWREKHMGIKPEDLKKQWIASTPLGRLLQPEDIAKVVVFLCSDESAAMTGQAINVTGGIELH